jgi:16S rRNA (guanine527-N7)-methyltransferase
MTEDEAKAWLVDTLDVSRETLDRLERFVALLVAANDTQNLISAATIPTIWSRHIVDSAQLLTLAAQVDAKRVAEGGVWLDLGSGPGLPGLVLAILNDAPIHLVEERKGRVAFLNDAVAALGLDHVTVHGCKVQALDIPPVAVITARAFAPLPKLFTLAHSFSTQKTIWMLPKGKSATSELESVRGTWQGMFHVKQSVTDPDAAIILASGVRKAGKK